MMPQEIAERETTALAYTQKEVDRLTAAGVAYIKRFEPPRSLVSPTADVFDYRAERRRAAMMGKPIPPLPLTFYSINAFHNATIIIGREPKWCRETEFSYQSTVPALPPADRDWREMAELVLACRVERVVPRGRQYLMRGYLYYLTALDLVRLVSGDEQPEDKDAFDMWEVHLASDEESGVRNYAPVGLTGLPCVSLRKLVSWIVGAWVKAGYPGRLPWDRG